jgi:hypothetical protein
MVLPIERARLRDGLDKLCDGETKTGDFDVLHDELVNSPDRGVAAVAEFGSSL